MVYSYSQVSQYVRCPRSYRFRYLDGWREKETRAAMMFGRCFEKALGAYFCGEDGGAVLFKEWSTFSDTPLEYSKDDSWDRIIHQGIHLLEKFARDDRIHIRQPKRNLQIKMVRTLPPGNEFVAYLDALGELDGRHCLIDWKTTTSRYPEEPQGLLSLDPQLICYSWISGISDVALVVFVRKRSPEIQYLRASISEEQRREFGQLVETTVGQIEAGQ
ncbi:MAG: PD-(D/E)XK nuclease family protein, partial [Candidatus Acidiferrales bacterium]